MLRCSLLILVGLLATAPPLAAKIRTTKQSASSSWSPLTPLVIGSGFEFQTDSEQSQYDFPILVQYNVTEALRLTVEPNFVHIGAKTDGVDSVTGFGDLETSVEFEFLSERRLRPAVSAEALIKWPTATDSDIGSPGRDTSFGLILSKDLEVVDLDSNLLYTFVGDPDEGNTFEISLAGEVHLGELFDLEAEVLTSVGTGSIRGRPGTIGGLGSGSSGTEGTLGLAWHANEHLKLEVGGVLSSDGSWQLVSAWEWSFSGED